MVAKIKWVLGIILVVLVIVFAAQNMVTVEIRFLTWEVRIQRALLIFTLLLIGIAVGWLWRSGVQRGKR